MAKKSRDRWKSSSGTRAIRENLPRACGDETVFVQTFDKPELLGEVMHAQMNTKPPKHAKKLLKKQLRTTGLSRQRALFVAEVLANHYRNQHKRRTR